MAGWRVDDAAGIWALIAVAAFGTVLWMWAAQLTFAWTSAIVPVSACLGLAALASFYRHRRPDPRIAATLTGMAQLVAFSIVGATLQYAVASTGRPLWDDTLYRWDQVIGLDWKTYLVFVEARPWLAWIYSAAYDSLEPQLIVIVTILGFTGRIEALRDVVLAFVLAALAAILVSGLMPAVETYVHLRLQPQDVPHLPAFGAALHASILHGLRDGTIHTVSLTEAEGIITFPSLHAALGVTFTLVLWPLPWLRWPALVINGFLVAATPVYGGHYFADLIAGGALGVLAFGVARAISRRSIVEPEPLIPRASEGARVGV